MDFYEDKRRGILLYPTQAPFLLQALPDARTIAGKYLAVPKNLRNHQILRHYNHPVPPVITDENYDWPIEPGKTPGDHQKTMANFDVLHRRAFNVSDPGTQKTLAKLWAADWLMRQYPPGKCRALILAPLTILETVWASGIFKTFLNKRTVEILHGDAGKRRALLAKKPDFAILNYDGVKVGALTRKRLELDGFSLDLANDKDIQITIVDEADNYCDAQTGRNRIARLVFGECPNLWMQTGTPTGSAPTDAYGMAKIMNNCFGKSFKDFRNETMVQVSMYRWIPRADGYDKARRLLTPAIRFDIKDVWKNAPPFLMQQRKVELTAAQIKALNEIKNKMQVEMKNGVRIDVINEAAARTKFLQIVQGDVYDGDHRSHAIDAGPRYAELDYLVKRATKKVVIYISLTNVVNAVYKHLSKTYKCGIINGDVQGRERTELIRSFERDDNFRIVIADPQTTAHGINEFVVADTVIWMGPTEKTRLYIQGNLRLHRPGQNYPVNGYQIVATKLEQEIYKRLENNTSLQGALLDSIKRGEL